MIHIRPATPDDAPALLAIYAPYVTDTAITFEYEVPALSDFRQRIEATLRTHPYLVLERDGEILGYARAEGQDIPLRAGESFRWPTSAEETVTVRSSDPHLSRASIDFHTRLGYAVAGTFHRCGYKFGTWYDVVWMEKRLSDDAVPPAVVPYSDHML